MGREIDSCLMLEGEPECALRDGKVYVPRIQRVEPWCPDKRPFDLNLVQKDGAVLVTGGIGGIGQRVARWLAEAHGIRDIVLVSRRGLEAPGAEALVHEMAQLGAAAAGFAGDVADGGSVWDILSLSNDDRPLRGAISALTPSRRDVVFAPKADGAWNLHQLSQGMDLDLLVLFPSIPGVMGTGQCNNAAANTFSRLACFFAPRSKPTSCLYSMGRLGGRGDGSPTERNLQGSRARDVQLELDSLASQDGLELLEQAVRRRSALQLAAAYDLDRLRTYYEDRHLEAAYPGPVPRALIMRQSIMAVSANTLLSTTRLQTIVLSDSRLPSLRALLGL